MKKIVTGMILFGLLLQSSARAEEWDSGPELTSQPPSAFAPQPTPCITSAFTATGDQYWKMVDLMLTNNCGITVDFQNASVTFLNKIALNTPFWGTFDPLSYPDNDLRITSQLSNGSYLAAFNLHFPNYGGANSKLPAGKSIHIQYGASSEGHIGDANVSLGDTVPTTGSIGIISQVLPTEINTYTGKPTVVLTHSGGSTASAVVDWNSAKMVSQLIMNGTYSFSTDAINFNGYQCLPKFDPASLMAGTVAPLTKLTYSCTLIPVNPGDTPVAINGQLKTCGTQLCNKNGVPIQLKGMSTHGIQWYGWNTCITPASLDTLAKGFNANVIRISLYVQEGGYETNPTGFTQQVNQIITEVTKRGLYAIVDWHILTPGDPNYNLSRAKTFFTAIATANKDKVNLLYEIANEPNGVGWSAIKSYAEQLIPVIRAIDDHTPIIVGTPGWSSLGISDGTNSSQIIANPVNATNLLYAFHFYAVSHRDEYLNELDKASNSLPIFVTEFGTQDYSGGGSNDFVMGDRYMQLMASKKIGFTNWNFSDDALSGAIWKSGTCSAGAWTDANLKPSGVWIKDKIKN